MNAEVLIATYGDQAWQDLAWSRAYPSAMEQAQTSCFHDPEGTIASVRNEIAASAKAEWLCFLDADDEIAPGYLDAMERALEREPASSRDGLLLTPAVSQVRKGARSKPFFFDRGIPLSDDNWLVVGTLIRRDLFMEVGGFSDYPHGFEDWSLWAKCWKRGVEIVKVPQAVYIAHVNPRSKHKTQWRDRQWQVAMHNKVRDEIFG